MVSRAYYGRSVTSRSCWEIVTHPLNQMSKQGNNVTETFLAFLLLSLPFKLFK